MLSIDWPFSSFFSISTSSLTPSTTICTSSTSEKPRRSALEMSKVPPTAAVSTPPEIDIRGTEETHFEHCIILVHLSNVLSIPGVISCVSEPSLCKQAEIQPV
uniref:Uncharacterized protein n=1 Tax=Hucho hucho TaxID=62062 RepID=A0A4W5PFK9_9TELE